MSKKNTKVECETHGSSSATFLCKHLAEGEGKGFNVGYDPENLDDLKTMRVREQYILILETIALWHLFFDMICSMSRKGECHDNAVAESFFHTLKEELVYNTEYKSHEEARQAIFKYIELFYNRKEREDTLTWATLIV